jgi:hypothetical protein
MWVRNKNGRRIFNRKGKKVKEGKRKTRKKAGISSLFRLLRLRGSFLKFFMYQLLQPCRDTSSNLRGEIMLNDQIVLREDGGKGSSKGLELCYGIAGLSFFLAALLFFSGCVTVEPPPDEPDESDISDSILLAAYFPETARGEKIFDSLDDAYTYVNEGINVFSAILDGPNRVVAINQARIIEAPGNAEKIADEKAVLVYSIEASDNKGKKTLTGTETGAERARIIKKSSLVALSLYVLYDTRAILIPVSSQPRGTQIVWRELSAVIYNGVIYANMTKQFIRGSGQDGIDTGFRYLRTGGS